MLRLAERLHKDGVTVVAVLHDLHLAFRYATHLVFMKDGKVVAQGSPCDVVTPDLIQRVFSVPCQIIDDPEPEHPGYSQTMRSGCDPKSQMLTTRSRSL